MTDSVVQTRSEQVDLRMSPTVKRTLLEAASASQKSLIEFLLGSCMTAAETMLADRKVFVLDDVAWAAFMAALDKPPADNPKLQAPLNLVPVWEA